MGLQHGGSRVNFLPFHRPTISRRHVQAVAEAVRSGWLTSAGKVLEFEAAFAKRVGAKHGVAVNSCTAALHLALIAKGVGPEDEVITSPVTFASAVNVIEHVGAKPVFVDVFRDDLTINCCRVKDAVTRRTKAIVATHFAGWPAHVAELEDAADGVPIIWDAAHGIEVEWCGWKSGEFGGTTAYSFYATKNITTGEGGMLTTDDGALAERARLLRLHGMTKGAWDRYGPSGYKHWDIVEPGWKYNLGDVQAALGLAQLADMDAWLKKRVALDREYRKLLSGIVPCLTGNQPDTKAAHHLFVVFVPKRDLVMDFMQRMGVGVGVHFRAVHLLEYYLKKYKLAGTLPVSEGASDRVLSLPLYPLMTLKDVRRVVDVLLAALTLV